ncbi:cytochrome P450 [Crossiella cryophila]|uniref:Cytochrome P450 n=1 Tax=Crossiella cryophila TaxID=43355 RepID=A0A7W7FWX0_9PSEU|nr:cytochrome P450 [Crossiella cryophila]MBB4681966.1 cytochrome P450 [Crossiella cryophila]
MPFRVDFAPTATDEAEQVLRTLFGPDSPPDPYPLFARLRELAPVHRSPALGAVVLTRFADCGRVLGDTANFRVVDAAWRDEHTPDWRDSNAQVFLSALLAWRNPPEHTRLRRLLTRDFTVRRVEALRPAVRRCVDAALDRLAADGAGADLVDTVLYPVTMTVISELIGVPEADRPRFRELVDAVGRFLDPQADAATKARGDAAALEYRAYFQRLIEARRREPRDDLASALLAKRAADPDQLGDEELVDSLIVLFGGGFETTAGVLGNGLEVLLRDRVQWARLVADPELADSAVEELVRWDTAGQLGQRVAVAEAEVGGLTVHAGESVMILTGAANRDPARFAEPDRFDIGRADGRSLSFGHGIHLCLGAALARLEMTTLLGALVARFPELRLSGPAVRRPTVALRGLSGLPVRF